MVGFESAAIPEVVVDLINGPSVAIPGKHALPMWLLLNARSAGVSQAEARESGADLDFAWHELRRDFGFEIDRGGGVYILKTPLRIGAVSGLPKFAKEVLVFWENRFDAAEKIEDARLRSEAAKPIPTARVEMADGSIRTIRGEPARYLQSFRFGQSSVELPPAVAAQLADIVEQASWIGGRNQRVFSLCRRVRVVEIENCGGRRGR